MSAIHKVVVRKEGGYHFLYFSREEHIVTPLRNRVQTIVLVETEGNSQKLNQIFPGVRINPGERFAIISLED